MDSFSTQVSGKWILAGEHAVLRGFPALVFPLLSKQFSLKFLPADRPLQIQSHGERGSEFEGLFWSVLDRACELTGRKKIEILGQIEIMSSLPIGAGLGASASLCVALSRWFASLSWIKQNDIYDFARDLENLFHGESSGVDVAVALGNAPLYFVRGEKPQNFDMAWEPRLCISYSGKRGVTLDCVNQVKQQIGQNPSLAHGIDADMGEAVRLCASGLAKPAEVGFAELMAGIELAQSCFVRWALVDQVCTEKIKDLRMAGAQAVKMTGSGGGGYILSLWKEPNLQSAELDLISCF